MRTQYLCLIPLLATLYACQPEAPKPAADVAVTNTADATSAASAVPISNEPVAAVAPTPTPTPNALATAKTVAPVDNKSNIASKGVAPHTEQKSQVIALKPTPAAIPAPSAAKVEPVITPAVSTKPEVKAEATLADADALLLAKKSGCLTCHSVEKKIVGPAWRDVAAKYRGDTSAQSKLSSKVAQGGKGVWGSMAMPANSPRVADTDIHSLVRFILALK